MGQQTSTVTRASDFDPTQARLTGADGGTPISTAITYGQDDTGTDLKVFGDTSGTYMLWDESVDSFLIPGTTGKFQIGSFTGAAIGTGSVVSASATAPFKVFADDGGTAIGSGSLVRAGWFRNLQTYTTGNREQEACGVQGSLVSVAGTNRHNMCGVLGSWEARTSIIVGGQAASTDVWVQAGVIGRVGMSSGTFNVDTNARLCGLAAMSNVNTTCTETFTGVYAGLYIGKWASTNSWTHGIYIEPSAVGKAIQVGTLSSSSAGSGLTLTSSVTRAVEVNADDNDSALGSATTARSIFGRTMNYASVAAETWGIDGLCKFSTLARTANVAAGVVGRIESTGTCSTSTGTGNTFVAGVMGRLGLSSGFTIGSGTYACGVLAFYNILAANDPSGEYTCAFMATATDFAGAGDWDYGLYVEDAASGIYSSTTTKAFEFAVSALPANARGARFAFTCAAPAMSDGYGAHEIDLTIGTATGPTSASSCWINAGDAATVKSYAWIHNDGVWLGNSCTATSAAIAYARVHFVFGTNTSYDRLHLFDLNLDVDQNMTSLINVNNLALIGFTSGSHASGVTGSVPFIGSGASVKYVRLYDTAA